MSKEIYSITQLEEKGYPKKMLRRLIHSKDFGGIGFRLACSKNSKTFFYKDRLDKWIEQQMDENGGVEI